ncbi:MAG TPA: TCR/Tet family MFS transporter [Alphaproteobacteria bacterium]
MTSGAGSARPAAVVFIFITILLDMLSIGMIVPVLPRLVVEFKGGDTAAAAAIYGVFGTAWALMQFLFSPIQGALSDRFGRRPVILASNLGLGLDYVLMALAPNLVWLFIGRVISGITAASVSTGFAYIADITPPERRAASFGRIGIAFGVGFIVGPALGGVLGGISPRLPFWVAAAFSLANACYGFFILPESLPADRRAPFSWRRANPIGSLVLLRSHAELLSLAAVHVLSQLAHAALPAVIVLYVSYRYGWNETQTGLMLAGVGLCTAAVQGGLIGRVVRRFGERATLLAGLLCGAVAFVVMGLAETGLWYWVSVPVMALWGLANPALQGLASKRVTPNEQGQLQGALGSLQGIANLIGPTLFTGLFATFIAGYRDWQLPGAPFLMAALLLLLAAAVGWRTARG